MQNPYDLNNLVISPEKYHMRFYIYYQIPSKSLIAVLLIRYLAFFIDVCDAKRQDVPWDQSPQRSQTSHPPG
jgi:hypothetical protein